MTALPFEEMVDEPYFTTEILAIGPNNTAGSNTLARIYAGRPLMAAR